MVNLGLWNMAMGLAVRQRGATHRAAQTWASLRTVWVRMRMGIGIGIGLGIVTRIGMRIGLRMGLPLALHVQRHLATRVPCTVERASCEATATATAWADTQPTMFFSPLEAASDKS